MTQDFTGVTPGVSASPEELQQVVAKIEVSVNGIIKRLMIINDVYGNDTLRQAILDELNGLIRMERRWLTTMDLTDITPPKLPASNGRTS